MYVVRNAFLDSRGCSDRRCDQVRYRDSSDARRSTALLMSAVSTHGMGCVHG
jgi:hypothetical protein